MAVFGHEYINFTFTMIFLLFYFYFYFDFKIRTFLFLFQNKNTDDFYYIFIVKKNNMSFFRMAVAGNLGPRAYARGYKAKCYVTGNFQRTRRFGERVCFCCFSTLIPA